MDNLFDRAQDLIDKAHEKVASTASQAAFVANQSLVVRQLESHIAAIDNQIDALTRMLGEQTYAAWRATGSSPDMSRVAALCNQLDGLKVQREEAAAQLASARDAAYTPNAAQWTPAPPALAASTGTPTSSPPVPAPSRLYVPPPATPYAPPPYVSPAPTPSPSANTATGTPSAIPSTQWSTARTAPQPAVASVPHAAEPPIAATYRVVDEAPARASRECPNCGHFVPGDAHYCPSCGAKVV